MCGIDYLKNYLTDNGFKWREEGEIFQFSYHELTCVVPVDTTDAVRIFVMFGTEEDDISLLSEVCNDINKLLFLVKCFIHNGKLFFTLYFEPNEHMQDKDYKAYLASLTEAVAHFNEQLKKRTNQ